MDTSEQYIKMCEKIPFDQSFKIGDHIYSYDRKRVEILIDFEQLIGEINPTKLYRQDQLQEMFEEGVSLLAGEVQLIWEYMRSFGGKGGWRPETWEQLWLAFVMKEKFGKMWDGEQWIG